MTKTQKSSRLVEVALDEMTEVTGGCDACGCSGAACPPQKLGQLDPRDPRARRLLAQQQQQRRLFG